MIFKYLHTGFIILWVILATTIFGLVTILASFFSKTGDFPHLIARAWAQSILFVSRVSVQVRGLSKIDPSQSYIYMANHQSNFDIPVLLGCLRVQFRWLAKAELFKIPVFGRGMKGCGYISIDRSDRKSAFKSLREAACTIRDGTSVLIFPEGTRSQDGKIRPFKKGGFVLAVDSGVPIVPVVIHGTWSIMPRNRWRIEPAGVVLEVKQPIATTDYTRRTKDDLLAKVRQSICESFDKGQNDLP
jgi:1-acyl-sn-glycerol-3-phosphate acyltransferase